MRGIAPELLFDYLATNKGFMVCRPVFDKGYDRIVEHKGKMSRIQIKSVQHKDRGSYLVRTGGTKSRKYRDEFDYYAIYLKHDCVWVILPAHIPQSTGLKVSMKGKYSKYFENWEQLK